MCLNILIALSSLFTFCGVKMSERNTQSLPSYWLKARFQQRIGLKGFSDAIRCDGDVWHLIGTELCSHRMAIRINKFYSDCFDCLVITPVVTDNSDLEFPA